MLNESGRIVEELDAFVGTPAKQAIFDVSVAANIAPRHAPIDSVGNHLKLLRSGAALSFERTTAQAQHREIVGIYADNLIEPGIKCATRKVDQ